MDPIVFTRWSMGNIPRGFTRVEAFIFEAFLIQKRLLGELMAFQVPLHGGNFPGYEYNVQLRNQWDYLTSYKADVIMKIGSTYTIYEIKDILDSSALGQLITYKYLFEKVIGYPSGTFLAVVAVDSSIGAIQPLIDHGIQVHLRRYSWNPPPIFSAAFIRSKIDYHSQS